MSMTLETLQVDLETYPERLAKALERQAKANRVVEQSHEALKEAMFGKEDEDEDIQTPLTVKVEKERLRYEQQRAKIEMDYRRNPPEGNKITEASVTAYLKAHDELCTLKEKLIDMEHQLREERLKLRSRPLERKQSETARKLADKVEVAQNEKMMADIEVATLESQLETYRMLTALLLAAAEGVNTIRHALSE